MSTSIKNALQDSLATFGLNPDDWVLEYCENDLIRMENIEDTSFQLHGRVQFKKNGVEIAPDWVTLSLVI